MKKTPNETGRPPKHDRPSIYSSDLYKLLRTHLPLTYMTEDGRLDTAKLSESLDCKRYTIYRWFNGNNMSVRAVNALVDLSEKSNCEMKGLLTKEKLLPFCGL